MPRFKLRTLLIAVPFVAVWVAIHLAIQYAFRGTSYEDVAFFSGFLAMIGSGWLLAYSTGGIASNLNQARPRI
jgi:hypothetical protein